MMLEAIGAAVVALSGVGLLMIALDAIVKFYEIHEAVTKSAKVQKNKATK